MTHKKEKKELINPKKEAQELIDKFGIQGALLVVGGTLIAFKKYSFNINSIEYYQEVKQEIENLKKDKL